MVDAVAAVARRPARDIAEAARMVPRGENVKVVRVVVGEVDE